MPVVIHRPSHEPAAPHEPAADYEHRVTPSRVHPSTAAPFTLDQELEPFGSWVGEPIWAPPLDSATALAESMLESTRPFTPKEKRWAKLVEKHRDEFTQVREIDLDRASIRLPKGRFFVSVTEQKHFDRIEEAVPACVETRLEEFLDGPKQRMGAKVYYLKPLCVEVGDDLILTSREDMQKAIDKVRNQVMAEYDRLAVVERPAQVLRAALNAALALPRAVVDGYMKRQQRAIDAYHARMEFERRKTALRAANAYRRHRTDGCTFDEMLALTNPLDRASVVRQFSVEQELSNVKRDQLLKIAAGSMPWFVTLSACFSYVSTLTLSVTPPLIMCDPAFVAEVPNSGGRLLKIGHFDEVGGVMHIEL